MVELSEPEMSVEKLAEQVRAGALSVSARVIATNPEDSGTTPPQLRLQPAFTPREDDQYHVDELLQYHDRNFIQNAYRAILKRGPDATGYEAFIGRLRRGEANKIDILARLRYSREGRSKRVRVDGLFVPAAIRQIYRIPVLGYVAQLCLGIVRLPVAIRNQQQFEAHAHAQALQMEEFMNDLSIRLRTLDVTLRNHFEALLTQLRDENSATHISLAERVDFMAKRAESFAREVQSLIQRVESRAEKFEVDLVAETAARKQVKAELTLHELRIQRLLEVGQQERPAGLVTVGEPRASYDPRSLDVFYAELEDHFRGTMAEVEKRLSVYLPVLREAAAGSAERPVLDLGSGRGEWLGLLTKAGMTAKGIEQNLHLVAQSRTEGLDVIEGDILQHLSQTPDESMGAITAFHVAEHLELETLIRLIDEVLRVLAPGGVAIFETPNPANVLVGSCNFYFDPTHRNPIPSPVLKFFFDNRGFESATVMELNPSEAQNVEGDSDMVRRFNKLFYGPMDYAVIARKGRAKA
jgi:O-antigen chain-terminating methyltransferase